MRAKIFLLKQPRHAPPYIFEERVHVGTQEAASLRPLGIAASSFKGGASGTADHWTIEANEQTRDES